MATRSTRAARATSRAVGSARGLHPATVAVLEQRLTELVQPAVLAELAYYRQLGLRCWWRRPCRQARKPAIGMGIGAMCASMLKLPLIDREIPLVTDTWAKPELGSGCVKGRGPICLEIDGIDENKSRGVLEDTFRDQILDFVMGDLFDPGIDLRNVGGCALGGGMGDTDIEVERQLHAQREPAPGGTANTGSPERFLLDRIACDRRALIVRSALIFDGVSRSASRRARSL